MKLTLNDDGTITVPLVPTPGVSVVSCTLREPSIDEIGDIFVWADEASEALPPIRVLEAGATPEEAEAALAEAKARTRAMYGAAAPHAKVMVRIVQTLAQDLPEGFEVHSGLIPGWACNPRTIDLIVNHFTAPLAGTDARAKAAVERVLGAIETT